MGIKGRNQGGVGEISLPSASADVRGHPRHVWTGDGRWEVGNNEGEQKKIGINGRNQGGIGEIMLPSASVSFRGSPWKSETCAGGRRKMENNEENRGKLP